MHDADFCKNFTGAQFPFVFDKAIFQYPAHNSNSLITMLSHKNTVRIVTTKAIFWK